MFKWFHDLWFGYQGALVTHVYLFELCFKIDHDQLGFNGIGFGGQDELRLKTINIVWWTNPNHDLLKSRLICVNQVG